MHFNRVETNQGLLSYLSAVTTGFSELKYPDVLCPVRLTYNYLPIQVL